MKLTTGILGCALVAGLMTFAANNVQAAESASSGNIVINNTLYSPINVKLTVKFVDGDKIKTASATSKDLLADLGFDTKQVKLCLGENQVVYVVNKKNGSAINISSNMTVNADEQISTSKSSGKDDENFSYQSEGTVTVSFEGNTTDFVLSGLYSASLSTKFNSDKSTENVKTSAKTMTLSGNASSEGLGENLPASGSASGSGSGTLQDL